MTGKTRKKDELVKVLDDSTPPPINEKKTRTRKKVVPSEVPPQIVKSRTRTADSNNPPLTMNTAAPVAAVANAKGEKAKLRSALKAASGSNGKSTGKGNESNRRVSKGAEDAKSVGDEATKFGSSSKSGDGRKASKRTSRVAHSPTLTAKSRGQRPSTLTPSPEVLIKRDLAHAFSEDKAPQDRFILLVRDPYWLQAVWEFSRGTIQRAEAALGADWHRAVPTLRVLDVSGHDATSRSETRLQDIQIHGGVNYWYVPIDGQPRSYRLQIGYLTTAGRYQVLARSNVVTPPRPGTPGTISGGWDDLNGEYQRVFALSGGYSESSQHSPVRDLLEERLGRPIESWDNQLSFSEHDSQGPRPGGHLPLTLHAELVIHGITLPDARVSVVEEPAKLKADGSFQVRLALEDGRHLIRTVASRADGSAERTVILSIERNTKELEPHAFEGG